MGGLLWGAFLLQAKVEIHIDVNFSTAEQEFDEYGDGIGADEWDGKNGNSFRTPEEEKMWMEAERTFFDTVSPPP